MPNSPDKFKDIKLIILDVDGVLTDGSKLYDKDGKVVGKRFNDKDFTAIKRFAEAGVKVVWLSGDTTVNQAVARDRNIDFYHSRVRGKLDKASFIEDFEKKYKCSREDMVYVGDDYFDLDIMKLVGFPVAPQDCCPDLYSHAIRINRNAGEGVVMELFALYQGWSGHVTDDVALRAIDAEETIP